MNDWLDRSYVWAKHHDRIDRRAKQLEGFFDYGCRVVADHEYREQLKYFHAAASNKTKFISEASDHIGVNKSNLYTKIRRTKRLDLDKYVSAPNIDKFSLFEIKSLKKYFSNVEIVRL